MAPECQVSSLVSIGWWGRRCQGRRRLGFHTGNAKLLTLARVALHSYLDRCRLELTAFEV